MHSQGTKRVGCSALQAQVELSARENEKNSHGCKVRPCSTRHICPCVKLTVVDVQSGLAALDLLALAAPLEVALSSALADAAAAAAAAHAAAPAAAAASGKALAALGRVGPGP